MEDVVLAFPPHAGATNAIRSTLILSSIASLRAAGHYDAYCRGLDDEHREAILQVVAGVWLPLETGLAHYRAGDSLALSADAVAKLGAGTFERIRGTLLGTVLRMANGSGVTPWTVMPHLQRFWDRAYRGGALQVTRVGPKDARLEIARSTLPESPYFRHALRGLTASVIGLFCEKVYVHETRGERPPGTMALQAQWV
jgi:hypothetical protein